VALGVSLVVFALVHLSGDPVLLMVSSDAPADVVMATRHALGFDRPLYEQYARYVTRAAQGDLGTSLRSSSRGRADHGEAVATASRAADRRGHRRALASSRP
jgi:ABC-type dipeptide/oligopeptide/nickel transport system permease component